MLFIGFTLNMRGPIAWAHLLSASVVGPEPTVLRLTALRGGLQTLVGMCAVPYSLSVGNLAHDIVRILDDHPPRWSAPHSPAPRFVCVCETFRLIRWTLGTLVVCFPRWAICPLEFSL